MHSPVAPVVRESLLLFLAVFFLSFSCAYAAPVNNNNDNNNDMDEVDRAYLSFLSSSSSSPSSASAFLPDHDPNTQSIMEFLSAMTQTLYKKGFLLGEMEFFVSKVLIDTPVPINRGEESNSSIATTTTTTLGEHEDDDFPFRSTETYGLYFKSGAWHRNTYPILTSFLSGLHECSKLWRSIDSKIKSYRLESRLIDDDKANMKQVERFIGLGKYVISFYALKTELMVSLMSARKSTISVKNAKALLEKIAENAAAAAGLVGWSVGGLGYLKCMMGKIAHVNAGTGRDIECRIDQMPDVEGILATMEQESLIDGPVVSLYANMMNEDDSE